MATGGVTFRLTPASSIVGVAVVRPSTGWVRPSKERFQPKEIAREHERGVDELAVGRGVAGVALVAPGDQVHHHEPALRGGDVEIGRLADHRGVDRAGPLDRPLHRRVPGLLAVAEDRPAAGRARVRAPSARSLAAVDHRRDRGLRVARAAAVEPVALDRWA